MRKVICRKYLFSEVRLGGRMVAIINSMSHQVVKKFRRNNLASTLIATCQIAVTLALVSGAKADVVYPAGPTITKDGDRRHQSAVRHGDAHRCLDRMARHERVEHHV